MNDYGIRTVYNGTIEEAEVAITDALKSAGFGVLTRIDVALTLKNKIDVDRRPYVILGACNPTLANRALTAEVEMGLFLPCNVIVYQNENDETVVSAIDPMAMVGMLENSDLNHLADDARPLLQQAVESIK